MQYHAIPCNTMQYHAIPCNTMQYHAIPCIINYCWRSVPLPCGQFMAIFLQHRFVESQENGLFDFLTKYQARHSWSISFYFTFYYFHFQGTICLPVHETSASVWLVKLHFGRWSIKLGNCLQIIKLRGKWWMAGCIVSKLWINALPTKEVSHFRGNRICLASLPLSLPHVAWKASKCIMLHFYH